MMKISRNSKGFTLIELLIVVAIIGILAAIAIPAYTGYTKKAKVAGVVHALGAIKNALCAYYTESSSGAVPNAADTATVGSTFGVTPTTTYATFAVVGGTGTATITGTLQNLGADLNTTTITLGTTNFGTWTWGGTAGSNYVPKD